jgi:hypothetical protein
MLEYNVAAAYSGMVLYAFNKLLHPDNGVFQQGFLVSLRHNVSKTDTVSSSCGKGKRRGFYFCRPVAYIRHFMWEHQNKIRLSLLSQPKTEK